MDTYSVSLVPLFPLVLLLSLFDLVHHDARLSCRHTGGGGVPLVGCVAPDHDNKGNKGNKGNKDKKGNKGFSYFLSL